MNWNTILGITATGSFLLPVGLILYKRLYVHRPLLGLLVYNSLCFLHSLMELGVLPVAPFVKRELGILNNYLDAPLMLLLLLFFCIQTWKIRMVQGTIIALLSFEILVGGLYGFSAASVKLVLGPGILLIMLYSLVLFVQGIKGAILQRRRTGRMVMLATLFFTYGSYAFIYLFHYISRTPAVDDVLLLYFLTTLVSSVSMSLGLYFTIRPLQELRDLQITRRELRTFFEA